MQKEIPLWTPPHTLSDTSRIGQFAQRVGIHEYDALHEWSCQELNQFWDHVWDFCDVIGDKNGAAYENAASMKTARFFKESTLNYAENLLRQRGTGIALTFWNESLERKDISHDELHDMVSSFSQFLTHHGVVAGDRVAGYLPNIPETIVAMIATASIGAIWSSCSPDFGIDSVCDRFSQITPKIFITVDQYQYAGKLQNTLDKIQHIQENIPSIEQVVLVSTRPFPAPSTYHMFNDIMQQFPPKPLTFKRFPFNYPLAILFSSGTTGVPKCIIHGAGGTLIQHMKEHQLQCNVKAHDTMFYYTTCGWMMWNWLVSGLASCARLVLFDGSPTYPTLGVLMDIAEKEDITLFGTSAKYLHTLQKNNYIQERPLPKLRTITSTGSPLAPETYDYVYDSIKHDVHLASIAGGTDIISCFLMGNVLNPVYRGELQCAGLGYKIEVYDDNGCSLPPLTQGELVCTRPFPSQPVGFFNDPEQQKYHHAYFARYDNVWHHGDRIERTMHNGFIIHGRSDALLNPGGVRIGTAEIYRQVLKIDTITEALAIGQEWDNDVRIILFVLLKMGHTLDDTLRTLIKEQIKRETTPRHVPAKIIQVYDLPRTRNGKLAEIAVRNAVHGKENTNLNALENPESLDFFKNIPALL